MTRDGGSGQHWQATMEADKRRRHWRRRRRKQTRDGDTLCGTEEDEDRSRQETTTLGSTEEDEDGSRQETATLCGTEEEEDGSRQDTTTLGRYWRRRRRKATRDGDTGWHWQTTKMVNRRQLMTNVIHFCITFRDIFALFFISCKCTHWLKHFAVWKPNL